MARRIHKAEARFKGSRIKIASRNIHRVLKVGQAEGLAKVSRGDMSSFRLTVARGLHDFGNQATRDKRATSEMANVALNVVRNAFKGLKRRARAKVNKRKNQRTVKPKGTKF